MEAQNDNIVLNNAARTVEVATFNRIIKVAAGILGVGPVSENEDETVYRLSEILLAIAVKLEKLESRDNTAEVAQEVVRLFGEQAKLSNRLLSDKLLLPY